MVNYICTYVSNVVLIEESFFKIANIGCADYNYDETLSTLRYANRAKHIVNNAHINEDPKDALLRKFQQEIEMLRRQLAEGGDTIWKNASFLVACGSCFVFRRRWEHSGDW